MSAMLARILKDPRTERVVLGLIIFNAVTLGLETSPGVMARHGALLHALDRAVLTVFCVELAARIYVFRWHFFRDPWSLFDLIVLGIALVPVTGSLSLLLLLIFYVFSVMAAKLFGATSPELFGHFGAAAYTLFQVMTFDDWSAGIVKPLMAEHAWAWLFFVVFILLSTFMVLNLFIGVVVSALDEETARDAPKLTHPAGSEERVLAELAALRADIAALREEKAQV